MRPPLLGFSPRKTLTQHRRADILGFSQGQAHDVHGMRRHFPPGHQTSDGTVALAVPLTAAQAPSMLWLTLNIGGGRWQSGRRGSSHADSMAGSRNDKTPMKFWCKFAASLGIAVAGALLVLSGGSLLGAANDALFSSSK